MKGTLACCGLLAVVLLVGGVSATEYKDDEGVLALTKDTFDAAIEEFTHVLVEFCRLTLFVTIRIGILD